MTAVEPTTAPAEGDLPRRGRSRTWFEACLAIPAAVLPLLPSATCPACVTAYAGVLSSLGLGAALTDRVQRPLIVFFLIVSMASVGWATRLHRKPGPLALVIVGSLGVATGRLFWDIASLLYPGVFCLFAGTLWNLYLKRHQTKKVIPVSIGERRSNP